jgi:hypothetical protein
MTLESPAVERWLLERGAQGRDLDHDELATLAAELAAASDLWQPLEHHVADDRFYVRLCRDHHLDAWLICWMPSQDTGLHDHDLSSGAVHVTRGTIAEERLVIGLPDLEVTTYQTGQSFRFDSSRIHNVCHAGTAAATSLHLYSPPIWRMGYYAIEPDGRLGRRSATYVDELGAGR